MAGPNDDTGSHGESLLAADPLFGPLSRKFKRACEYIRQGRGVRVRVTAEEMRAIEGNAYWGKRPVCLGKISFGNCEVDLDGRQVYVGGQQVYLRLKEYTLLCALILHPYEWLALDRLTEIMKCASRKTTRVWISNLRKRLGLKVMSSYIQTSRWGENCYRFCPDECPPEQPKWLS